MLDRSVAPPSEAIKKPKFPTYTLTALSGGATLYAITQPDQPIIMLELVVPIVDNPNPEVSQFLCKMLTEGTRKKNSVEIAEALEYHGSHLEIVPSLDHIYIRLYSLKRFFQTELTLLTELLTDSVFPEREFEIARTIRIQQLHQQQAKTAAVASQKFRESIFGSDHPYGKIVLPLDTEAVSIQEVKDYFTGAFRSIPTVFLTGDISDGEKGLVSDLLETIQFNKASNSIVNQPTLSQGGTYDWKNAVQTSMRLGGPTIDRSHADIHTLKITMDLFGGFFGSRLMKNIREEKGLTYGINASISHLQHASLWSVSTDVLKEKADLALAEIQKEIQLLKDTPPSKKELETVVNYTKGKFLMSFDSAINSQGMIRNLVLSGQDYSFWEGLLQKLDTVTPEEISQAARMYLNLDTIVKVG